MASHAPRTITSPEPVLLGPLEDLFWGIEEERPGAFRAAVVARLDGCVEADRLSAALEYLQGRHPKLRAGVSRGPDGRRRYVFTPAAAPIPFEIKDFAGEESPWREEIRRLLDVELPAVGPLAAVTVLRDRLRQRSELLITVHHAIADGLSALMLVDDLLSGYADAEAAVAAPPPAVRVVTTARATVSGGWRHRVWLLRRFVRLMRREQKSPQTALPETNDVPPQSQWVHWVFSREETLRIVRRCRTERTSLGGALVAAVCCGLMDCLPVPEGFFKCQSPFDVRHLLESDRGPVAAEDLGCFVGIMNGFYTVSRGASFWDVARSVHEDVQGFVEHGGPAFSYNLATAALTRVLARAAIVASTHRRVTLLATNYGVASIRDAYGSLRPTACTLMFKQDRVGPSLVMEALVLGQRLNVGFAADCLVPTVWDQLHAAVRRHLDRAAEARTAAATEALEPGVRAN